MDSRRASDLIKDQRSSWCWWHQNENTRLFLLLSQSGKRCRFFIAQKTWPLASGAIRNLLGTPLRTASSQEFHGKTNKVGNSCFLSPRWLCAIQQVFTHLRPRSHETAETPQVCIWAHARSLLPWNGCTVLFCSGLRVKRWMWADLKHRVGCLFLLESHMPSNKESNEGYKPALPRVTFNVVYVSRNLLKHSIHFHIYPYLKVLGWSYREPSWPVGKLIVMNPVASVSDWIHISWFFHVSGGVVESHLTILICVQYSVFTLLPSF